MFDGLQPWLIPYAQSVYYFARSAGVSPRITSVRRTYAQQEALYRRYQMGLNPFPVAPPGSSLHEHGLAFDMMTSDQGRTAGALWDWYGGQWSPSDYVHFGVRR